MYIYVHNSRSTKFGGPSSLTKVCSVRPLRGGVSAPGPDDYALGVTESSPDFSLVPLCRISLWSVRSLCAVSDFLVLSLCLNGLFILPPRMGDSPVITSNIISAIWTVSKDGSFAEKGAADNRYREQSVTRPLMPRHSTMVWKPPRLGAP